MQYREEVPRPGMKPLVMPWPMSNREAAGYVSIMCAFTTGTLVAVVWLSVQLIEPSLWRIAPAIVWAALLRWIVAPAITRSLVPKDPCPPLGDRPA